MPTSMLVHERAQFAIYGMMLLTPLLEADVRLGRSREGAIDVISVEKAGWPRAELLFEPSGRLASLRTPDAEGGAPVQQTVTLSGRQVAGGVAWPKRLKIRQGSVPYFDLAFDQLSVS